MPAQIILASASPRRKDLLAQINVKAIVHPVELDETPMDGEQPLAYVQRLAAEKSALCLAERQSLKRSINRDDALNEHNCLSNQSPPILAADTAVVVDGCIMGKPKNQDDCVAMLCRLSGRTHQVYSAVSLRGDEHWQAVSVTEVSFRKIQQSEITAYWQSGEPADKAGAYGIQGLGALFVEKIVGSYSGVMGLPLFETAQLLAKQGIDLLYE